MTARPVDTIAEQIKAMKPPDALRFAADCLDAAGAANDDQKRTLLALANRMASMVATETGALLALYPTRAERLGGK